MHKKFEGVLLAADIDGTLYNGEIGTVPKRNKEAIAYFRENGGLFTLATGRSVPNARFMTEEIPLSAPAVLANGTMLYDYNARKIVADSKLPKEANEVAKEVLAQFPQTAIKVMAGEEVFYYNSGPFCKWVQKTYGIQGKDSPLAPFPQNTNKILFCNPPEESQKVIAFCKRRWPEHPTLSMVPSATTLYEVLPKNVNKATGITQLAGILGLKAENIYVIGDYYNDREMLEAFPHSFVPSAAPDDLKALCEAVFGSCEEGAVADLIDYMDQRFS